MKFYAVRVGRKVGIFENIEDCLKQVEDYKGSEFKSFDSKEDASGYLNGEAVSMKKSEALNEPIKEAENVKKKSPKVIPYYDTYFIATRKVVDPNADPNEVIAGYALSFGSIGGSDGYYTCEIIFPFDYEGQKKIRIPETTAKEGSFTVLETDDLATAIYQKYKIDKYKPTPEISEKFKSISKPHEKVTTIYTDGACKLKQGPRLSNKAGFGVFFFDFDVRNKSGRVRGIQTSQRAELVAIYSALIKIKQEIENEKIRNYKIVTDSQYCIDCLTKWCKIWETNGWKNKAGKDVSNRDILKLIVELFKFVNAAYEKKGWEPLRLRHIGRQSNTHGSLMAEKFAYSGCDLEIQK